jgi:hypothetical protein
VPEYDGLELLGLAASHLSSAADGRVLVVGSKAYFQMFDNQCHTLAVYSGPECDDCVHPVSLGYATFDPDVLIERVNQKVLFGARPEDGSPSCYIPIAVNLLDERTRNWKKRYVWNCRYVVAGGRWCMPYASVRKLAGMGGYIDGDRMVWLPRRPHMDVMDALRIGGSEEKMPVHYLWYNVLRSLGWQIEDAIEDPARLYPDFFARCTDGRRVPVVCEPYAYMPGDTSDKLATNAFRKLERHYPGGVMVVFAAMPFRLVNEVPYSFGGRLYDGSVWHDFALTKSMVSIDAVLDQVQSGFRFGDECAAWADTDAQLARAVAIMRAEIEPSSFSGSLVTSKYGDWHMLLL